MRADSSQRTRDAIGSMGFAIAQPILLDLAVTSATAARAHPHSATRPRAHAATHGRRGIRYLYPKLPGAFLHALVLFGANLRLFLGGLRGAHLGAMRGTVFLGHQLATVDLLFRGCGRRLDVSQMDAPASRG